MTRRPAQCDDHPDAKVIERWVKFDCGCMLPESFARRNLNIWQRCKACADQMFTGVRCLEHNPYYDDKVAS